MRIAFPTDEHVPYQDDRARSIALKIVHDFKPDVIISGSDGLDFYGISTFDKDPSRIKLNLQEEIDAWHATQREWADAVGKACERHYIPGNHEDRLRRWLWKHPDISSLRALKLSKILDLEKINVKFNDDRDIDYRNYELVFENILSIRHGEFVRKFSGYSGKAELEKEHFSISTITGHSHRGGSTYYRTRQGVVQAHEGFCLCRLDPEYVRRPDWQQGIVLAEVTNGSLSVDSIVINEVYGKKRAMWRGKEYLER